MLVLDASAAAELLLGSDLGLRVAEAVAADGNLHAPHLLDAEVLSTVRSLVARAEMAPARAVAVLDDLADLPITRHAAPPFLARAWELRSNVTGHDALYVALPDRAGVTPTLVR